ncbi:MAG: sensor histidine kinase [Telluria sp.]
MWNRIVKWYDEWEQEQLDVLADPGLAATVQPGYRQYFAHKLAEMSPIERHELREFSITYRGRRLWIAIAKMVAAFSAVGVLLHFLVPAKLTLLQAVIAGNVTGFACVMAAVSVWFSYRKIAQNKGRFLAFFIACAMLGGLSGAFGAYMQGDRSLEQVLEKLPRVLAIAGVGVGVFMAVPLMLVSAFRNRHYESLTKQLQMDAERERLARELSESQLRILRAQIEPHFLFNTLGAVQQLAEQGAPRAAELTANLIAFLRASMSDMRSDQVSLGAEFRLVESYLQVMQARLGARLAFSLSLPEALTPVRVPSMILLTLVENAIKHGIEPSLRGGDITVSAQRSGGTIRIQVRDTGAGMGAVPGTGVGLENVRRRLQLAHGDAAVLAVEDTGDGVVADMTLPDTAVERVA